MLFWNRVKCIVDRPFHVGGGPVRSTETVGYFMYRESFTQFKLGYGAAATVILLAAVLLISIPAIIQRTRSVT